jgi:hypothetical protein
MRPTLTDPAPMVMSVTLSSVVIIDVVIILPAAIMEKIPLMSTVVFTELVVVCLTKTLPLIVSLFSILKIATSISNLLAAVPIASVRLFALLIIKVAVEISLRVPTVDIVPSVMVVLALKVTAPVLPSSVVILPFCAMLPAVIAILLLAVVV